MASAIDFVLEGLYAQKKISRSDERGYAAGAEAAPRRPARREEPQVDEEIRIPGREEEVLQLGTRPAARAEILSDSAT